MIMNRRFLLGGLLLAISAAAAVARGTELVERTWAIDGVTRTALIHSPERATGPVPVVFAFHGHGGSARQASRSFPVHAHWPEAIVVYPQGLPTPGQLTDPDGRRSGWQPAAGTQGDRDLKFFDAMLADLLANDGGDPRRVHALGHSNGGGFTYLLWAERGEKLAAVAPSSAVMRRGVEKLRPKPALHLGSPEDELVKFAWQERMIDRVLELNGCPPREPAAVGYREYPSRTGTPLAVFLHDGGHKFPTAATRTIVDFLRRHSLPEDGGDQRVGGAPVPATVKPAGPS